MFLIFDTETTGLPRDYNAPLSDSDNWPRAVQIAWQLHDEKGHLIRAENLIVKPDGFTIPYNAEKIHGISTQMAENLGKPLTDVLDVFLSDLKQAKYVVGHNIEFDINILGAEFLRLQWENHFEGLGVIDTKDESTEYCAIPGGRGGKFKWPKLEELHEKLFNKGFSEAHNACADVEATARCFFGLCNLNVIQREDIHLDEKIMDHLAEVAHQILSTIEQDPEAEKKEKEKKTGIDVKKIGTLIPFTHLHNHTQFSVLQAISDIHSLIKKAAANNAPAVAITDHGNMYGAFQFWQAVDKHNGGVKKHNEEIEKGEKEGTPQQALKCIIGCELNITNDRHDRKNQNNGYTQVFICKNKIGYQNLIKLSSIGFTEGYYYVPRIDKEVLVQYKNDLIATTGSLTSEIPSLILNVGESQAEEAFCWWHQQFGDDFYVELNRHNLPEEDHVNKILLEFAKKYNVKYFAANSNYYTDKSNANAHDILLCVKDGALKETPIGRGKGYRFGFPNQEFYFKSTEEMNALFHDMPEALEMTTEIVEKIEEFKLGRDVLLPKFEIPEGFEDEDDFLRHLTYEGAKTRYPDLTPEIKERIDFELATIKRMGFPGYFLIVQDFTTKAREMGVSVGPGRGSAAGSAIAYCLGITNVDPIKYDLLFERFLNPDRISMPDIDIDFDDEGRESVIQYVINKYGKSQVAQIITYGTMGGKSALRDTARVLNLALPEADRLAKTFPDNPAASLRKLLGKDGIDPKLKSALKPEQLIKADEFRKLAEGFDLPGQTIQQARELEGCVRNTGIHACGVIITPDELTKFVPVAKAKDSELLVTQFDNSVAESAGLLKMDFLGLKTLTIIKDAIKMIEKNYGVKIDPDQIPLDDEKTYQLFQRGETNGIFQFESPGMQKNLRELKPDVFTDLIAMNALYRPGPLAYIPNYIRRKHGTEDIVYDFDVMKEVLEETYGITVYQEQVMKLSQKLADFTKGDADVLRKAMGKKQIAVLDKMKSKFLEGCSKNGHDTKVAEKIWKDWEAFAQYAFNKSHSTCYAYLAFHTGYLKAHYPAEYMASVLTHNQNNIEKVTFFMEECKNIGVKVLGPHVNESGMYFEVNKEGQIRFGLGAIKGTGEAAVEAIISERNEKGPFSDLFEFSKRVNLRAVNKKTFECLAMSGAFDCFEEYHRRQFLFAPEGDVSLIEKAIKYANKITQEKESMQGSLFGGTAAAEISLPKVDAIEPFGEIEKLKIERDVVGLYISGHPLDQFKIELDYFCNCTVDGIKKIASPKDVSIGGTISNVRRGQTKNGKPYAVILLEDYNSSVELFISGESYLNFQHFLNPGEFVFTRGKIEIDWRKRKEQKENPDIEITADDWVYSPNYFSLLADLKETMCKGIVIDLDLFMMDEQVIHDIDTVLQAHAGNLPVKINLVDHEERMKIEMTSRKYRVNSEKSLFDSIGRIAGLEYEVIGKLGDCLYEQEKMKLIQKDTPVVEEEELVLEELSLDED